MQTCVALWKEINQHLQNVHMQLGEQNPWKTHKKIKNKKTCKLVLLFQGCFAMWTCIALTFSRELWKSHSTKDEIFKPLHKDNPNKKQVGTQFIVMKGNGQKPNMGRKYSSKMPMNKK
jgi:hypothetical protein